MILCVPNPLGNKTKNIKLQNCTLSQVTFQVNIKYDQKCIISVIFTIRTNSENWYDILIQPLVEDITVLASTVLNVDLEKKIHNFKDTVTMVVADNLTAHASGGFSVISVYFRFCCFCNVTKQGLIDSPTRNDQVLRTQEDYESDIMYLI